VRFGTFQRLAHERDNAAIEKLLDYCITHFEPDLAGVENRAAAWFARIVDRTALLAAQWMAAGFVHGVLNTDNMNVTGESFDYGPWRFLPVTDFSFTAAYFDETGLYAYGRQPEAALWNLSRLGGTLLGLASEADLYAALSRFSDALERAMAGAFFRRLGLAGEGAFDFVVDLLKWMEASKAPFERVFFDWFGGKASAPRAAASPVATLYAGADFAELRRRLESFEPLRPERLQHPFFAGEPCTMLIDEVEAIWAPIAARDDWRALDAKLASIAHMREGYDLDPFAGR
jgi:uncharacterized protein YdiU (UPF0061 family)